MSQSLAALAALESLPQPHLQVLCGTTSHGVNADGHDCVLQADLGVQTSLSAEPPRWTFLLTPALEALLRQEPQWRLYLRAKSLAGADSGISLHVVRNEDLAGLRMSSASIAVAAILQASPIQQPWYIGARSQLPCAEMVAESAGIRGRGLLEVASADKAAAAPPFGLFCDGWWEAVLQDPRPKSDEALFLEDVIIAVRVPTNEAGARLSLRAFCCLTRSADAEPHPLSPPALLDCALAPGLHLLRSPVGRRSRYLRISMSGSVVLLGVEAFCAELLPPSGTLRQCLARVVRAYAPQPAVAVRAGEGFQKFSYSALWSDVECFSSAMRSRYDLDTKVAQDEDVVIAWIGSTCLEAFFCFLACMANQWCFMALGSSQLAALSVALPTLTVGEQPSELKVPHLPSAEVGELVRQGRRLPEGPQASLRRSASMIFTSGSTGTPKAIRRDHEELYSFLWLYAKAATPDSPCHLAYQPYSHMNEQLGTAAAFLQGSCLAFSSAQTAYADARIVEPTGIQGVPRFFEPLLSVYESKEATLEELRLSFGGRLHSLTTGSAPVTKRLFDFLRLCFESCSCSVTNSYGATEVGPIAHNGRVNPNVEVKIVPLTALGHDPGGFTGEVRVRCKNTRVQAQAYVGATLALDEDGFYCTGDIGCYKDDFLELLGRVGNVAKMANGLFLSAEGLEEKYASLVQDLDQVFIIANPEENTVAAACVVQPRSSLDDKQLLSKMQQVAMEQGLGKHEVVSRVILESQPWTFQNGGLLENQKINRPALLARYKEKLLSATLERPKDSMEMVRLMAEARRRGVALQPAALVQELVKADLAAAPAVSVPPAAISAKRFLVTGATGLLGRELVASLLADGKQVVALVRKHDGELPVAVEQVLGDVSHASLGTELEERKFDAIFHAAAVVNWALSYAQLRPTNVVGTWQMVQVAMQRGVPLFYISTISVAAGEAGTKDREDLQNGYVLTKLAAEAFVRAAFSRGLHGAIFRPGMLCGSTTTGAGRADFFPDRFLQSCLRLGCCPESDAVCDWTPVDYAAKVIVRAAARSSVLGRSFHVYNPRSPSYAALATLLRVPPVPLQIFWQKVRDDPENPMAPLEPLLAGSLPVVDDWGDANLQQVLGADYNPPQLTEDTLR
ncbi:hetM [Symbiodinium sp. CCMP2456]|nr:hetM [Symbiodinium sp. CCMP2456]